jgi:lipopolysaccharide assembly LptE-like protein
VRQKVPSKTRAGDPIERGTGTIESLANRTITLPGKCRIDSTAPLIGFYFKFQISNLKFELFPLSLCVFVAFFLSACGYHVGGTAAQLPPGLKVIAVPALKNDTPRYRIEQRMTEAVVHEFIARTKYRIVSSEDSADAVLHGEITSFEAIPAVFDTTPTTTPNSTSVPTVNTTTARATTMLVSVHVKVSLQERETNKVLYKNDDYLFREPYEISTDPSKFFDEQGPALERMSRDFAARLVSDVMENF